MKVPDSMKAELEAWFKGEGIDLEGWITCSGNFSLAVGYTSIFCPEFVEFEDYIFRSDESVDDQCIATIRGFESQKGSTPLSVEKVINHLHVSDLHFRDYEDISPDKIIHLGNALKETYEARLTYFFPNKPCVVKFYVPEDPYDYDDYQLTFWQKKHEQDRA